MLVRCPWQGRHHACNLLSTCEGGYAKPEQPKVCRLVEGEAALRMMESEGSARLLLSRPSSAELADGELSSPERPSLLTRASAGNAFGERQVSGNSIESQSRGG